MENSADCGLVGQEEGFKFAESGLKSASICEAITLRYFFCVEETPGRMGMRPSRWAPGASLWVSEHRGE